MNGPSAMGRKGSNPEGSAVASARFRRNLASLLRSREARHDLWPSFLNLFVESDRERGSLSPKVSGKAIAFALLLLGIVLLCLLVAVLAQHGFIPNWKT